MRALLAQLDAPGTPERGVEQIRRALAGDPAADLVAVPELYLTGYDLEAARGAALGLDDDPIRELRGLAGETGTALAVGFAEQLADGVGNSLALIDEQGSLAAVYRKAYLFGAESDVFEPGSELVVAELAGLRVGALICFDMEFPEAARELARAGAQVLLTASANMEPFFNDHLVASQARALDNRLPHLYVNRCGEEAGLRFVGGTRAVRADGTVADAAAGDGEETFATEVDPVPVKDDRIDYLAHVRDDLRATEPSTTGGTSR